MVASAKLHFWSRIALVVRLRTTCPPFLTNFESTWPWTTESYRWHCTTQLDKKVCCSKRFWKSNPVFFREFLTILFFFCSLRILGFETFGLSNDRLLCLAIFSYVAHFAGKRYQQVDSGTKTFLPRKTDYFRFVSAPSVGRITGSRFAFAHSWYQIRFEGPILARQDTRTNFVTASAKRGRQIWLGRLHRVLGHHWTKCQESDGRGGHHHAEQTSNSAEKIEEKAMPNFVKNHKRSNDSRKNTEIEKIKRVHMKKFSISFFLFFLLPWMFQHTIDSNQPVFTRVCFFQMFQFEILQTNLLIANLFFGF